MGGPVDKKAAHAERDQVVDALKTAFAQGRLTKDEFDLRMGQALAIYADLDALTADIPALPPRASLPEADASRQLHNKRMMQRGTAVGTAVSMAITAMLASHNAVLAVVLTVVVGVVMSVTLSGLQTLLWWALERNERNSYAQATPPGEGDRALGYLASADTDPRGQSTDEPGHTVEAARRRDSSGTGKWAPHRPASAALATP